MRALIRQMRKFISVDSGLKPNNKMEVQKSIRRSREEISFSEDWHRNFYWQLATIEKRRNEIR